MKLNSQIHLLFRAFHVLRPEDRKKTVLVAIVQVAMGFLDLFGVAIVGVLGALAVAGIETGKPGNRVGATLRALHLQDHNLQYQISFLGILAGTLFIVRTIFSIYFTRRSMFFLASRGAAISAEYVSRFLNQTLLDVQKQSSFQAMYSLTTGIWVITIEILGSIILAISDSSLLLVLSVGLFVLDPVLALSTILVFGLIGFLLYRSMHVQAKRLGLAKARLDVASNAQISEVIQTYREAFVRDRRYFYGTEIGKLRYELSKTDAEYAFMPYIGKYIIEATVILGSLVIGGIQFALNDAVHAVATLTVFMAAGARIAPAVLRLQQGALLIRTKLAQSESTIQLLDSLHNVSPIQEPRYRAGLESAEKFNQSICISNLSFVYPDTVIPALSEINLNIASGSTLALVGPSGAGKTTLVDLILGVHEPTAGSVTISNRSPSEAIHEWPGKISYVPQNVSMANKTILENIALGFPVEEIDRDKCIAAAITAHIHDFIISLPDGYDANVGENGSKLSGGQRQRIGIARALYTSPEILVLDEATSALDGETESDISDSINQLKGSTTVILIAHRLSSVRAADEVIYLEKGSVIASGNFESVRTIVPDFDRQARLMGL